MKRILNTAYIAELIYVEERVCVPDGYEIAYEKGARIFYIFPFLHKEKYAKEDYYRTYKSCGNWSELYTLSEVIKTERNLINESSYLFIKNDKIYKKAHARIIMVNGNTYTKYFNTNQECKEFIENVKKNFTSSIEIEL